MPVRGLDDYRIRLAGLTRMGARAVSFHVQLSGVPLHKLMPLPPKERGARLRATLMRQLTSLTRHFSGAAFRSRDLRKGSWTLDGTLPANQIQRLALRPEVAEVWVSAIAGRSKYRRPPKDGWFCVWGIVAIHVEGQRSGKMEVEDRLVLVKANDVQDAVNRLRPEWERYAEPYLNPNGYLVRWQLVGIKGVYSVYDERFSPQGTEVYSRLRTVKVKPGYRWNDSSPVPDKRLQPTAHSGIVHTPRLKRRR